MLHGLACALALLSGPAPSPSPVPTQDAYAERLFLEAKEAWRTRADVPYLRYGALIRYLHNGHVFDNWWDVYARTSDGQLSLFRMVDPEEDRRRLSGVPFSIFGVTIFDTNPDAEPIRLDEPRIEPTGSFGIVVRPGPAPSETPLPPAPDSSADAAPNPDTGDDLREIGRVEATTHDYRIEYVGIDTLRDGPAQHLTLQPLRQPTVNRLRELWLDPTTHRTMQIKVAGILNGKPYDGIEWTVRYVELEGRNYLQQVIADAPLHFGLDTTVPKYEIDFVDYHFPADVPKYTFDKPFDF
jgi:hypothetical protein